MDVKQPKVFISYAWSSRNKAVALADALLDNCVDVVIDVYDLKHGMNKYQFMQRIVDDATITHVLMLCDKTYREKANACEGGVGIEATIISPAIYEAADQEKFIPLKLEKDAAACMPTFVRGKIYIDFSGIDFGGDFRRSEKFEELLRVLWGKPKKQKPELGSPPAFVTGDGTEPSDGAGNDMGPVP